MKAYIKNHFTALIIGLTIGLFVSMCMDLMENIVIKIALIHAKL